MRSPRVSVIMPCHNVSAFVASGVGSVLRQSYEDFELIVVDDNSSDDTLQKLAQVAGGDDRVRIMARSSNGGAAEARNEGIRAARGRYIAFLDADDAWHPRKLELQIACMEACGAALSYTDFRVINRVTGATHVRLTPSTVTYKQLLRNNIIGCSTAIYDAASLGKRYFPKIRRRQDFGLWLDILREVPVAYRCGEALTDYSVRPGSVSSNKLTSALYTWRLYREVERLPLYRAVYYFSHYAVSGIIKTAILKGPAGSAAAAGDAADLHS